MPVFKSQKDLEQYVKNGLLKSVENLMTEIEEKIKEHIQLDFYGTYNPKIYPRSGNVNDTPKIGDVSMTGNRISSNIKLEPNELKQTEWSVQHGGNSYSGIRHKDPSMNRQELLQYIVTGELRDIYNDTEEEGKNILKETLDEIIEKDIHINSLINSLKKYGIVARPR